MNTYGISFGYYAAGASFGVSFAYVSNTGIAGPSAIVYTPRGIRFANFANGGRTSYTGASNTYGVP